jgi:hypothetical protein
MLYVQSGQAVRIVSEETLYCLVWLVVPRIRNCSSLKQDSILYRRRVGFNQGNHQSAPESITISGNFGVK